MDSTEGLTIDFTHPGTKVLLGAGSGMAPLRAIIHSLLADGTSAPVYFFYGARTEEDLLYFDEFTGLQKQQENFRYYPVLSQPSESWLGQAGYAQDAMFKMRSKIDAFGQAQLYLCGPQNMMQQTIHRLRTAGVNTNHIFWDTFGQPIATERD
ncbi:hypothetical protein [Alteromonas sp. ASW11-130]|uniref:hypothetical protein n=1 Tax=Alteromonas sp. ASW11-130 TaxID=3015775 RepID=UPI002241A9B8|nr:hypothetical protein [Alteromonas sp. ASW11-130]MCW8091137.1 hypothetical protein [Alteromonas sp. ASW11-130]